VDPPGTETEAPAARAAATVVVARPGPSGVEVLVLRRAAASPFGAGYVVFPGGVVDPDDPARAERWFGDARQAARACAVRELAEEASLAVMGRGVRALASGEDPESAVSADPPRAGDMPEMARWLAPEFLAVRFDATFFAAEAPRGVEARPEMVEVDRAWWARPSDVLREFPLWEALMWPTYRTLEALAGCATVGDVMALRVEQEAPPASVLAHRVSPEWRGGSAASSGRG